MATPLMSVGAYGGARGSFQNTQSYSCAPGPYAIGSDFLLAGAGQAVAPEPPLEEGLDVLGILLGPGPEAGAARAWAPGHAGRDRGSPS